MVTGPAAASYQKSLAKSAYDLPKSIFDKAEKRCSDDYDRILKQNQDDKDAENAYVIHAELGETMVRMDRRPERSFSFAALAASRRRIGRMGRPSHFVPSTSRFCRTG